MKIEMQEPEDERVKTALRYFRDSVHAWSEGESARPRVVKRTRWSGVWRMLASPAMGWGLACAMLTTGAGIPMALHHERQVAAAQEAAKREQQKLKAEEMERQAALAMNDEELMSHVDNDIAQATPDAMEPLASLMIDGNGR